MRKSSGKFEFFSLLTFLAAAALLLTNGFSARISAQDNDGDVYTALEPLGIALDEIMRNYVREVKTDDLVKGALEGTMGTLDRHSSYVSTDALKEIREDTKGEFEGIGVSIKLDENENLMIFMPIAKSPAAEAGIQPFDLIVKIDDVPMSEIWNDGMTQDNKLEAAAKRIKGPRGTTVKLSLFRPSADGGKEVEVSVKRDRVPLESIKEARLLEGGFGYIRILDFKDTTAADVRQRIQDFLGQGMKGLVVDLRWNPGGLLTASQETCELFLPKGALVTSTKGRPLSSGQPNPEDMELHTEKRAVLPEEFPLVILVNEQTASSSEIVTGALQYHKRALIVGERTFGKGSVQTIIPLRPARTSALRLTTALYYTPAGVTIDHQGILPDITVEMTKENEFRLARQMYESYKNDPAKMNAQNHGSVSGNPVAESEGETEKEKEVLQKVRETMDEPSVVAVRDALVRKRMLEQTIDDVQLLKAVEVLKEEPVWSKLIEKYHRAVTETQTAVGQTELNKLSAKERRLLDPNYKEGQTADPKAKPEVPTTPPVPATPPPAEKAPEAAPAKP